MLKRFFRDFRGYSERGVAMLEFTLVAPFLAMMIVATYDLGSALNQYLALTRVAYEGARYAATLPGLEVKATTSVDPDAPNHNLVRDRVNYLLSRAGFDSSVANVETENRANVTVRVTVVKSYNSFFGFFNNMPIRVSAEGPFLSLAPGTNSGATSGGAGTSGGSNG